MQSFLLFISSSELSKDSKVLFSIFQTVRFYFISLRFGLIDLEISFHNFVLDRLLNILHFMATVGDLIDVICVLLTKTEVGVRLSAVCIISQLHRNQIQMYPKSVEIGETVTRI